MAKQKQRVKHADESVRDKELKSSLEFTKTKTDYFAVFTTDILGSITFLICCIAFFIIWICWNTNIFHTLKPFDPFPFPILEMVVSIFAIILSVSVLINQSHQSRMDKIRQQVEFEINVRAEDEITKVLIMLHDIHHKLGLTTVTDQELEEMKKNTDVKQIHKTVNEKDI